tara:strand:- start:21 stop:1328 length:1308 start_codon:yes stop_codon:yes gene_type:complete
MAEETLKNLRLSQEITKELESQKDLTALLEKGGTAINDALRKQIEISKDLVKFYERNSEAIGQQLEDVGDLGDTIEDSIKGIPLIGPTLIDKFQLKDLGEQLQGVFLDTIKPGGGISAVGKFLMGPAGIAAAFAGILLAIRAIRKASFDLAEDLGVSREEARGLLPELKGSQMAFDAIGMDGSKIQSTLKEIGSEFGSLENMTVANARNIEMFAQNSGVAGSEIVKFNKVMMDLTGSSFDVATNMAKTAVNMAKSANVSTSKVLSDMASSANKFAEFSMQGAEGFAKAAVEAAKVGSSVNEILGAADKLLDFESSITAQFKAQVLTGKQINTERARQLALDGDIAGLTNEIQSIVGQVGDIQTLNVIQRQSVADAIGISVADLLRISRGEQAQQQETVQDKVDTTNKILLEGLDVDKKILEATEDKNVNIIQPAF